MATLFDERTTRQPSKAELQFARARALQAVTESPSIDEEDQRATTDGIPPERLMLARAGIRHLSAIVLELVELREGPERDEHGVLRPTSYAFEETSSLMVNTAIIAARENRPIPLACVATDSEGGVRIEWVREHVSVHLIVPANEEAAPYVYLEKDNVYGTEDVTPEILARLLREIE